MQRSHFKISWGKPISQSPLDSAVNNIYSVMILWLSLLGIGKLRPELVVSRANPHCPKLTHWETVLAHYLVQWGMQGAIPGRQDEDCCLYLFYTCFSVTFLQIDTKTWALRGEKVKCTLPTPTRDWWNIPGKLGPAAGPHLHVSLKMQSVTAMAVQEPPPLPTQACLPTHPWPALAVQSAEPWLSVWSSPSTHSFLTYSSPEAPKGKWAIYLVAEPGWGWAQTLGFKTLHTALGLSHYTSIYL